MLAYLRIYRVSIKQNQTRYRAHTQKIRERTREDRCPNINAEKTPKHKSKIQSGP